MLAREKFRTQSQYPHEGNILCLSCHNDNEDNSGAVNAGTVMVGKPRYEAGKWPIQVL